MVKNEMTLFTLKLTQNVRYMSINPSNLGRFFVENVSIFCRQDGQSRKVKTLKDEGQNFYVFKV